MNYGLFGSLITCKIIAYFKDSTESECYLDIIPERNITLNSFIVNIVQIEDLINQEKKSAL
jgi:hypothetical protein